MTGITSLQQWISSNRLIQISAFTAMAACYFVLGVTGWSGNALAGHRRTLGLKGQTTCFRGDDFR
jgi:hypothetical protein